jgi:hypothetical protein
MTQRQTDRIKLLRQQELEADEAKLLDDIEKYGCHIIQVRPEHGILGWSYTIGICDVLKQPELIVVGLKDNTAQSLLNEAAHRLEKGVNLLQGTQVDLLANVECEFKQVANRWLRQLMGYAIWFYDGDEFPALQCVYPDLNNRLPWQEGFDLSWRGRQALLFDAIPETNVERDLWASNDPDSSLFDWKFADPPHTGVFATKLVVSGDEPILYVSHDLSDGAWQFHGMSETKVESIALVCFHHLVDRDPTLKDLADLPVGWCASRTTSLDSWVREVDTEATT